MNELNGIPEQDAVIVVHDWLKFINTKNHPKTPNRPRPFQIGYNNVLWYHHELTQFMRTNNIRFSIQHRYRDFGWAR